MSPFANPSLTRPPDNSIVRRPELLFPVVVATAFPPSPSPESVVSLIGISITAGPPPTDVDDDNVRDGCCEWCRFLCTAPLVGVDADDDDVAVCLTGDGMGVDFDGSDVGDAEYGGAVTCMLSVSRTAGATLAGVGRFVEGVAVNDDEGD